MLFYVTSPSHVTPLTRQISFCLSIKQEIMSLRAHALHNPSLDAFSHRRRLKLLKRKKISRIYQSPVPGIHQHLRDKWRQKEDKRMEGRKRKRSKASDQLVCISKLKHSRKSPAHVFYFPAPAPVTCEAGSQGQQCSNPVGSGVFRGIQD